MRRRFPRKVNFKDLKVVEPKNRRVVIMVKLSNFYVHEEGRWRISQATSKGKGGERIGKVDRAE
jgi:hypothetical protein